MFFFSVQKTRDSALLIGAFRLVNLTNIHSKSLHLRKDHPMGIKFEIIFCSLGFLEGRSKEKQNCILCLITLSTQNEKKSHVLFFRLTFVYWICSKQNSENNIWLWSCSTTIVISVETFFDIRMVNYASAAATSLS